MALAPQPQRLVREITVGDAQVSVEIASTEIAREQGLSDRTSLPLGQGMLFIFERPDYWGIWMKDMRFPIDILWLGQEGTVVGVEASVTPDTYPRIFYPTTPALYVVELPAGFAAAHNVSVGSRVAL